MSSVSGNCNFQRPSKLIVGFDTLEQFSKSKTRAELVLFIEEISDSLKLQDVGCEAGCFVREILGFIKKLKNSAQERSELTQVRRYGDVSFREWYARLQKESNAFLTRILPDNLKMADTELSAYIDASFGDSVRLDYGTGSDTFCCIGARVFPAYNELVRELVVSFRLEPAGSKGSWGLDDYFFLPFYWGSAQLLHQGLLSPSSVNDDDLIKVYSESYMYFESISFIYKMKGRPLSVTSPLLYSISQVQSWKKINSGLLQMYQQEYLNKYPMMQHFLFGSILQLN